jgi:hypothetical protein
MDDKIEEVHSCSDCDDAAAAAAAAAAATSAADDDEAAYSSHRLHGKDCSKASV